MRVRKSKPVPSNIKITVLGSGVAAVGAAVGGAVVDVEHPQEPIPLGELDPPEPTSEPEPAAGGTAVEPSPFEAP